MPWLKLVLLIAPVRVRRRGPALALGVLVLLGQLGGQASGGGLSSSEGAVVFARGQVATVRTWEITGGQGLKAASVSGEKIEIAANDLLCLDAGVASSPVAAPRVLFRNGESISARLAAGSTGKRLVFESPLLGKLEADAKDVAIYQVVDQSPLVDPRESVKGQGQAGPASQAADRPSPPYILLKNGDLVASGIEQVSAEQVSVNTEFGQTQMPLDTVSAIVLSADTPPLDGRAAKQLLVELVDGQRLYCNRLAQAAGSVVLTRGPGECRVNSTAIRRIVWPAASVACLSEMPSKTEGRSYFGRPVEARKDRNALGGPLRIDNSWFSSGLGMRPRSRCVCALDGSWLYLAGYVGLDPMLGRRGRCDIAASVDGKMVLKDSLAGEESMTESRESSAEARQSVKGGPVRRLLLPVPGARQIELQVDFGPNGDLGDYVNWCDLLLVGQQRGAGRP